ncbi:putative gamma-glutamylcyclotransferase CG2811 isoform X2 [Anthonomus grandis grandis]|uniref:putative gamma-glutamylcyclotransferase CG2811 isoform X2 n=1 Tax=Anthonomus grandis grandis TaxID=2921223 RepID=UPI00216650BD|nr:putative gamma-glutamylcyclotransferase CG2811 isoform X2 [Anthonomus grandis grandis]
MSAKSVHKVFVYGTLKKGEPNHQWFTKTAGAHHKFLYNAQTIEQFPLIIATQFNIPFLLHAPGKGHHVQGEVYEVDNQVLADLDILEDHPRFYIREEYEVLNLGNNVTDKVWIYMMKTFKPELLNQTFFKSYSNNGDHGLKYVESEIDEDYDDQVR